MDNRADQIELSTVPIGTQEQTPPSDNDQIYNNGINVCVSIIEIENHFLIFLLFN